LLPQCGGNSSPRDDRFRIEWLPPYAPDANPVEHVCKHTKSGDLANYIPNDLLDPESELDSSTEQTRRPPELLPSFFHAAGMHA